MSNSSHIQRIGVRRSTVVAAIVAAAIGLAAAGPAGLTGHEDGTRVASHPIPNPGGGCAATGC